MLLWYELDLSRMSWLNRYMYLNKNKCGHPAADSGFNAQTCTTCYNAWLDAAIVAAENDVPLSIISTGTIVNGVITEKDC